jgi:hypothetical protein
MPLAEPPPRDGRFGSPLQLPKVHWVRPELVVEVTYLTWTEDNLLRRVLYQGQREDKPAQQVVPAASSLKRVEGPHELRFRLLQQPVTRRAVHIDRRLDQMTEGAMKSAFECFQHATKCEEQARQATTRGALPLAGA